MLLDYLEALTELDSVEAVWARHLSAMQSFGFVKLLYGFTRSRTQNSFGDRQDIMILTNHNEDYVHTFVDGGLYFHAPMVQWAAENVGACSWSWFAQQSAAQTEIQKKLQTYNLRHGISAGYTISFKDISSRAKGAIGLVSGPDMDQCQTDKMWAEHGRTITQMNNVAHLKLASLPFAADSRRLTNRQREVLEWVGEGKTTRDIATILGLAMATVEKHLRQARLALDVETTAPAVFKASFLNQIFVLQT